MKATRRKRVLILSTAILLLLFYGLAIAGTDVPRINRNPDQSGIILDLANRQQNETCLIQNKPTDPNNIIVAHNDDSDGDGQVGPGLGISYSLNGGQTWWHSHIDLFSASTGTITFDPAVTVDASGTAYAICINDPAPNWQPPVHLNLFKSTDKGATWFHSSKIRYYGPGSPLGSGRYLDKCWITCDTYAGSSYRNNIYVVWQEDDLNNIPDSYIYCAKLNPASWPSTVSQQTVVQVTETSVTATGQITGRKNPYDNAPFVSVAPNGDVYVAWLDSNIVAGNTSRVTGTIRLRKSTNGGASFDSPGGPAGTSKVVVSNFLTVPKFPLGLTSSTCFKQPSFPAVANDPTNRNNVYIVYPADPDGAAGPDDGDIYFTKSNDGGVTWSTPIVINNDGTTYGQFQPSIDVKPNGYIDIIWMDGRNDTSNPNDIFDIYMATSTDGGNTFPTNTRVSDNSFNVSRTGGGSIWVGDYLGLDVDTSTAYMSWTSIQKQDTDIWFDTMLNPNNTTTSTGSSVSVHVNPCLTTTFTGVFGAGDTFMTVEGLPPISPAPSGYEFVDGGTYGYFDLITNALYSGPIDIQFNYDPASVGINEANLSLLHLTDVGWEDCTTSVDTANNTITGQVNSLSMFALAIKTGDLTAPTITLTSPAAYSIHPAGDISFDFSAMDEGSGVKSLSASVSGGSLTQPLSIPNPSPENPTTENLGSGLYTLTITAKDNIGNSTTQSSLFVVYDPTAGFVTGGGWITPEADVDERANFGFVSKYKPGSTEPTGGLEFQYNYRTLNLKSTAMKWLVVSDNSAIFQGTATINGTGIYTYRVNATDGDKTAGKPDHFKITIWQGEDIEADPIHKYEGDLAGGSIVVHKK